MFTQHQIQLLQGAGFLENNWIDMDQIVSSVLNNNLVVGYKKVGDATYCHLKLREANKPSAIGVSLEGDSNDALVWAVLDGIVNRLW